MSAFGTLYCEQSKLWLSRAGGDVGLLANGESGFRLAVTLDVAIMGLDPAKADEIVNAAHAVCPYFNAAKGNVDVKLNVTVR